VIETLSSGTIRVAPGHGPAAAVEFAKAKGAQNCCLEALEGHRAILYSITSCRYMGGVPAGPEGALGSRTAHGAGDVVL
jgi:hypothetical protein